MTAIVMSIKQAENGNHYGFLEKEKSEHWKLEIVVFTSLSQVLAPWIPPGDYQATPQSNKHFQLKILYSDKALQENQNQNKIQYNKIRS